MNDPISESLERQDRFFRANPVAEGEPDVSESERWELMCRDLELEGCKR